MKRRDTGFTLIEIAIVLAIVGVLVSGATIGIRALAKSTLRGSGARGAGAQRVLVCSALSTRRPDRLTFDLAGHKVLPEASEARLFLHRDEDARPLASRDGDPAAEVQPMAPPAGTIAELLPSVDLARFEQFSEEGFHAVDLGGVEIRSVWTPRRKEPVSEGLAYAYYFPQGFGEHAVVLLADGDDVYSLVQHPLTGRVKVLPYAYETEHGGERDDLGESAK